MGKKRQQTPEYRVGQCVAVETIRSPRELGRITDRHWNTYLVSYPMFSDSCYSELGEWTPGSKIIEVVDCQNMPSRATENEAA